MKTALALLGALLALSACGATSDPASETPVELKPGNYDVWVRGALVSAPDGSARVQLCLSEFDAREWPSHPLEKTTRKFNGCFDQVDQPRGNALSGKRTCPKADATFTGEHGDERFVVRGDVTWKDDGRHEPFTITGRRTGDC